MIFVLGEVRITSTGKAASSPHCSSLRNCHYTSEYTHSREKKCANSLCNAQGYAEGFFVNASDNFCHSSHFPENSYTYQPDFDSIVLDIFWSQITADCTLPGDIEFLRFSWLSCFH